MENPAQFCVENNSACILKPTMAGERDKRRSAAAKFLAKARQSIEAVEKRDEVKRPDLSRL